MAVKSNVEDVQNALRIAENASNQAEVAKRQAEQDVSEAGDVIQAVSRQTRFSFS